MPALCCSASTWLLALPSHLLRQRPWLGECIGATCGLVPATGWWEFLHTSPSLHPWISAVHQQRLPTIALPTALLCGHHCLSIAPPPFYHCHTSQLIFSQRLFMQVAAWNVRARAAVSQQPSTCNRQLFRHWGDCHSSQCILVELLLPVLMCSAACLLFLPGLGHASICPDQCVYDMNNERI